MLGQTTSCSKEYVPFRILDLLHNASCINHGIGNVENYKFMAIFFLIASTPTWNLWCIEWGLVMWAEQIMVPSWEWMKNKLRQNSFGKRSIISYRMRVDTCTPPGSWTLPPKRFSQPERISTFLGCLGKISGILMINVQLTCYRSVYGQDALVQSILWALWHGSRDVDWHST